MKLLASVAAVALLVVGLSPAFAAALKSGVQPGELIAPFDVVKCAGAADDGTPVGEQLCYRCKYGNRPMVMVFSRSADKHVAELVKKLDKQVAANSSKKLAAFVNLLGENRDDLEQEAKQLVEKTKAANVPVVVPVEFENGPDNYGINPEADVTVILAVKGKSVATHALAKGKLDAKAIDAILADVPNLLK